MFSFPQPLLTLPTTLSLWLTLDSAKKSTNLCIRLLEFAAPRCLCQQRGVVQRCHCAPRLRLVWGWLSLSGTLLATESEDWRWSPQIQHLLEAAKRPEDS